MVDLHRAYRRWALRRFLLLIPSLALSVAVNLWIALGIDEGAWLKIVSLSISILCAVLLGYLLLHTRACARLQTGGERKLARVARSELAPYRGVALVCVAVLGVLVVAPALFRQSPSEAPQVRVRRPLPALPEPVAFTQVHPEPEPPALAAAERPAEAYVPPTPQIHPHLREVPLRMALEDWDPGRGPAGDEALAVQEPSPAPPEESLELPSFRPQGDPFAFLALPAFPVLDRPGYPDETSPDGPASYVRLDAILLRLDERSRGMGSDLVFDCPLSRRDSVRAEYFVALVAHADPFPEASPDLSWHRFKVEYVRRLTGYTRRAPLDLGVSLGFSGDAVDAPHLGHNVDTVPRVSPHAGLSVGMWQGGPLGIVLQAGQSIPLNLTGASSTVSDFSASLNASLSERLSLTLGYRFMLVRFREYSSTFQARRAEEEFETTLAGPILGLEARF